VTRSQSGKQGLTGAPADPALDDLTTEAGGDPQADYDLRPTLELVGLMRATDEAVLPAVARAEHEIAAAIDAIAERLVGSGRLIYIGAGSSGRIAALDAAECQATFSTAPGQIVALVAGGMRTSPLVQEAAEDDHEGGADDIRALGVRAEDAVVGISASGRTPYVVGAVEEASEAGAWTAGLVSVDASELGRLVDVEIAIVVGSEFLAGSTRLKAGTAQKLVLNTISTIAMIRLGKTFGSLMVDVVAANEKLRARVVRIVRAATGGVSAEEAEEALQAAGGNAKVAIVSLLAHVEADEARTRLAAAGDNVRLALER
jgi:N-acetylmuramic acid 6-phosphate etherase